GAKVRILGWRVRVRVLVWVPVWVLALARLAAKMATAGWQIGLATKACRAHRTRACPRPLTTGPPPHPHRQPHR
ncbi:hypothetical protein KGQ19_48975, partial [Catenulispora sp. NL8]